VRLDPDGGDVVCGGSPERVEEWEWAEEGGWFDDRRLPRKFFRCDDMNSSKRMPVSQVEEMADGGGRGSPSRSGQAS
jgi:hypothetical protein